MKIAMPLLLHTVLGNNITHNTKPNLIIIIIMNFYSPVSNTRCHSIGHKMRIARIKIRVDSPGRWEGAYIAIGRERNFEEVCFESGTEYP